MFAKVKVTGLVTALVLGSAFGSGATAESISAGSTGPGWASGARNAAGDYSFFLGVHGNQLDTCQKYSIAENGSDLARTWDDIAHPTNRGRQKLSVGKCKYLVYALRTIPISHHAYSSNCQTYVATGNTSQFDSYYRTMAEELAAAAPDFLVIRVGWELNDNFPWSIARCDTAEKVNGYKNTHRKIVNMLRDEFTSRGKTFLVSWNFVRDSGSLRRPLAELYPGDSYVDTIGVDYYDKKYANWGLNNSTDAKFREMASRGTTKQPFGIYTWFDFAMSMNKPLSVDEWGVWNSNESFAGGDNDVYIRNMYEFFNSRKSDTVQTAKGRVPAIAFEIYFNERVHKLGTYLNPKATAAYRALWDD
jgi:beta-mannanase